MPCEHTITTCERMSIENVNEETAVAVKELAHHILNLVYLHGMEQEPALAKLTLCIDDKKFSIKDPDPSDVYYTIEKRDSEGNIVLDYNFYIKMLYDEFDFLYTFNDIYHAKKIDFFAETCVLCLYGKFDEENNFHYVEDLTEENEVENSRTFGFEKWKYFFETHSFENSKGKIKYICYEHDWLDEEKLCMMKFDQKGLYAPAFSTDRKVASKVKEWGAVTFQVVFGDEAEHCKDFEAKARGFNLQFASKYTGILLSDGSELSPFHRDDNDRLITGFSTGFGANRFDEFVSYLQDFVDLGAKHGISVEIPNVLDCFSGKTITLARFAVKDGKVIPEFCRF